MSLTDQEVIKAMESFDKASAIQIANRLGKPVLEVTEVLDRLHRENKIFKFRGISCDPPGSTWRYWRNKTCEPI